MEFRDILSEYGLDAVSIIPYGEGHINTTYLVQTEGSRGTGAGYGEDAPALGKRYILQRINTETFRDPDGLMENICGVTSFLDQKIHVRGLQDGYRAMQVVRTGNGASYCCRADGSCYRIYAFEEGTICRQSVTGPDEFREAGAAFGMFQGLLADYPAASLHETIPHFHDTPVRYDALMRAADQDPLDRRKEAWKELCFVKDNCSIGHLLADRLREGTLPLRVTHNDTKLNNILFDAVTGKGVCVIDLDTVMPGLAAHDFGDAIRFAANDCAEDEPDQSRVHFCEKLYEAFAEGYLSAIGEALTKEEIRTIPYGALVMTYECGMRFLTDYLSGDTYFHISRPGQNLDRARTQFTLLSQMKEVIL